MALNSKRCRTQLISALRIHGMCNKHGAKILTILLFVTKMTPIAYQMASIHQTGSKGWIVAGVVFDRSTRIHMYEAIRTVAYLVNHLPVECFGFQEHRLKDGLTVWERNRTSRRCMGFWFVTVHGWFLECFLECFSCYFQPPIHKYKSSQHVILVSTKIC